VTDKRFLFFLTQQLVPLLGYIAIHPNSPLKMKRLCPAQHHSLPSTNTAAIVVSSSAIEIETSPPTNPASPLNHKGMFFSFN
jgi:hypothetical protein